MRNKLLVTAAMTALIGCTTFAMAQTGSPEGQQGKAGAHPPAAQPASKGAPGGNMAKPSGAETPQGRSVQEQPKATPQRPGTNQAQEEPKRETPQRGAQQTEPQKPGANERTGQTDEHTGKHDEHTGQNNEHAGQNDERAGRHSEQNNEHAGRNNEQRGSTKVSEEQRTKIKRIIGERHTARVSHPDFDVTVGTRIPRSVHLVVLPEDIVSIVPEYRGFDYILVGDQILIVDPNTLEIVAVIPA